ncbi:hypothetical protein TELCIR_22982, partial [Teladorsagia circumcincta]
MVSSPPFEVCYYFQAAERANVHMNLLMCCDTRVLRLNKLQDVIHASFRNTFPDLDVHKVYSLCLWTTMNFSAGVVEDYSLGTLMRIEACKGYSEENTVVVPK